MPADSRMNRRRKGSHYIPTVHSNTARSFRLRELCVSYGSRDERGGEGTVSGSGTACCGLCIILAGYMDVG